MKYESSCTSANFCFYHVPLNGVRVHKVRIWSDVLLDHCDCLLLSPLAVEESQFFLPVSMNSIPRAHSSDSCQSRRARVQFRESLITPRLMRWRTSVAPSARRSWPLHLHLLPVPHCVDRVIQSKLALCTYLCFPTLPCTSLSLEMFPQWCWSAMSCSWASSALRSPAEGDKPTVRRLSEWLWSTRRRHGTSNWCAARRAPLPCVSSDWSSRSTTTRWHMPYCGMKRGITKLNAYEIESE